MLQDWALSRAHPTESGSGDPQADAAKAIAGVASLVVVVGPAGEGTTRPTAGAGQSLPAQGHTVGGLEHSGTAGEGMGHSAAESAVGEEGCGRVTYRWWSYRE